MADRQETPRGGRLNRPSSPRRNDVIRCEKCGEDYSVTYKRCPFCDERPVRGGVTGRRVANSRGGGYGRPADPIQIVGLVISLVLIIAALFIIFTKIGPLLHPSSKPGSASSAGSDASQSAGSSVSQPGGSTSNAQPGSSTSQPPAPAVSTPEPSPVRVEGISLSKEDITLKANATYTFTVAVVPSNADEPVTWSSSDESIATVAADGTVTNVNAGTATKRVTITASCGDVSASCIVRCNPSASTAKPSGPVSPNTKGVINAEKGLNVRSGPGSEYDKVASVSNGAKVTILEDTGTGWYKIEYGNGKTGYVSSEYVSPAS